MMKNLLFSVFLILSGQLLAQYIPFVPDRFNDGRWTHELMKKYELQGIFPFTGHRNWTIHETLFTPDKIVRISQLHGRKGSIQNVVTTVQFIYNGDTVNQFLPIKKEYASESVFLICRIYKLQNGGFSYILISEDSSRNYHNFSAYVISLKTDTLVFIPFITYRKYYTNPDLVYSYMHERLDVNSVKHQYITSIDTFFIETERSKSFEKQSNLESEFFYVPNPYLQFDSASLRLSFESGTCPNFEYTINQPTCRPGEASFYILNSGTYEFRDSAFVMIADSTWHLPPLETLMDTIYKRVFQLSGEEIEVASISYYEYDYYGYLNRMLKTKYAFGSKALEFHSPKSHDAVSIDSAVIEPDIILMKDSSILVVVKSEYFHRGIGSYKHEIFRVHNNNTELLMSFTFDDDGQNYYRYKNSLGQFTSGKFELFTEEHHHYELQGDYVFGSFEWVGSSELLVKIMHWSGDIEVYRNYTITFEIENNVAFVQVEKEEILSE